MIKSVVMTVLVFSMNVFAQNSNMNFYEIEPYSEQNFRISFLKPMTTANIRARVTTAGMTGTNSESDSANGTGLALGYSYLPVQSLGFLGSVNFINYDVEGTDPKATRLEGNAAYSLNEKVYLKGGLNYSDIDMGSGDIKINMNGSIGYQFGVGARMNKNFTIDLTYGRMVFNGDTTFVGDVNGTEMEIQADLDLVISGIELGLTGTF